MEFGSSSLLIGPSFIDEDDADDDGGLLGRVMRMMRGIIKYQMQERTFDDAGPIIC